MVLGTSSYCPGISKLRSRSLTSASPFENFSPSNIPAILDVVGTERMGTPADDLIPDVLPGARQNRV